MYERFTDRARKVMELANREAQRFNREYIGTEHVLLGLIKEGSGVAANVLKNLDIDLRTVRLEVEKLVPSSPDIVPLARLPQTPHARRVIAYSMEEARNLNHHYVGTEHILLGLLREQEGVAAQVLMNLGVTLEGARQAVESSLGRGAEDQELGEQPSIKLGAKKEIEAKAGSPVGVADRSSVFSRFTDRARKAMQLANQAAAHLGHEYIGTEHILLGLVSLDDGAAVRLLRAHNIDFAKVRTDVVRLVGSSHDSDVSSKVPTTPRAKTVIELAMDEARTLNHNHVGTEHILLGLLREDQGVAAIVLSNHGLALDSVRAEVKELHGSNE